VHAGGSGWVRATPARAQVEAGDVTMTLDVRRAPVIRGRVQHADGRPAARANVRFVRLQPPDPPAISDAWATTDASGEFHCEMLEQAGTWVVVVPLSYGFDSLQPHDVLAQATVQAQEGQTSEVLLILPKLP